MKVAETVGYDKVVAMARRAHLDRMQPTPAIALGAYDVTPWEAVGAYTMFANGGRYVKPDFLDLVRDQTGHDLYRHKEEPEQVLDHADGLYHYQYPAGRADSRHGGSGSRGRQLRSSGGWKDRHIA